MLNTQYITYKTVFPLPTWKDNRLRLLRHEYQEANLRIFVIALISLSQQNRKMFNIKFKTSTITKAKHKKDRIQVCTVQVKCIEVLKDSYHFIHLAYSWVSSDYWIGSSLYTEDRWVHCDVFDGDKKDMPADTNLWINR